MTALAVPAAAPDLYVHFYEAAEACQRFDAMTWPAEFSLIEDPSTLDFTHLAVVEDQAGEVFAASTLNVLAASKVVEIALFEVAKSARGNGYKYLLAQALFDFSSATFGQGALLLIERFSSSGEKRLRPALYQLAYSPENKGVELCIPPAL